MYPERIKKVRNPKGTIFISLEDRVDYTYKNRIMQVKWSRKIVVGINTHVKEFLLRRSLNQGHSREKVPEQI